MKAPAGLLAGAFSVALLAGCGAGAGSGRPVADGSPAAPAPYATRLATETNDVREQQGLPVLQRSRCADEEAVRRAEALRGQELVHRPLGDFVAACAPGSRAAENLARSDRPAAEVVAAWMGSPGHRNNIVDPGLRQIGVGCARDGGRHLVCVQLFLGSQ